MHCPETLAPRLRKRLLAEAADRGKAVVLGPVFDTIKRVEDGIVQETLDRDRLRWPLAWAARPDCWPSSSPPPAQWFEAAFAFEAAGPEWDQPPA